MKWMIGILMILGLVMAGSGGCGSDENISGITRTDNRGVLFEEDENDWCDSMHPAFPNPIYLSGNELLDIILNISQPRQAKVKIINKRGDVVWSIGPLYLDPGRQTFKWNLKNNSGEIVNPGMYRLKLFFIDDVFLIDNDGDLHEADEDGEGNFVCHGDIDVRE
tara:strand:- start:110 stop:601 length:492 start_codon:yes stop_codon:yes gene_type:complete